MAIVVFVLSVVLLLAGAFGGYESLDLLPTGLGILYALAGAVGVAAAVITFAIGIVVWRLDVLTKLARESATPAPGGAAEMIEPAPLAPGPERAAAVESAPGGPAFQPVAVEAQAPERTELPAQPENEINHSPHVPSLESVQSALETLEAPPDMIGSYSSAGANYKIFADGSIEAETGDGTFRFASMGDFKRHLAETKAKTAPSEVK